MRKTLRDIKLPPVLRGQLDTHIWPVRRRAFAHVHCQVQYLSLQYTDKLFLGIWFQLVMQTPDHAIPRKGLIVLDKTRRNSLLPEDLLIIRLEKISAVIFIHGRIENHQSRD